MAAWQQNVLVTTPVLQPLVAELMEGAGKAQSLTNTAQSPHQTGFTPEQLKRLNEAEVIVALDRKVAPGLSKILATREEKGALVIYLTDLKSLDSLPYRKHNPFLSAHDDEDADEEHAPATDPHFWLDPLRVAAMLPELAEKIASYWPQSKASLQRNATRLALRLRAEVHPALQNLLTEARKRRLDSSKSVPVMTYHDAYQYFQKRYGLEAGYITQRPEEFRGARTMQDILATANTTHVRCLLSETDTHHVQRIAQLAQASVVTLNPERPYTSEEVPYMPWARNGYDRMLLAVAKAYASCL